MSQILVPLVQDRIFTRSKFSMIILLLRFWETLLETRLRRGYMKGPFFDLSGSEHRNVNCHGSNPTMIKKRLLNEKGQVLIFVSLAFVLLGMFIGLAVD